MRPNERFSGHGHKIHVCKKCARLPKEKRDAIEQQDAIFGFLRQKHISARNVATLEKWAQSPNEKNGETRAHRSRCRGGDALQEAAAEDAGPRAPGPLGKARGNRPHPRPYLVARGQRAFVRRWKEIMGVNSAMCHCEESSTKQSRAPRLIIAGIASSKTPRNDGGSAICNLYFFPAPYPAPSPPQHFLYFLPLPQGHGSFGRTP